MRGSPDPRAPARIGRYLLFDAFARGGMATIHFGRLLTSPGLSRLVAIKRLERNPTLSEEFEDVSRRLLEEARLLFRVRHPCVVPTLDVIQEGDETCLVLEYVHGVSLAFLHEQAMNAGEPLPRAVTAAIVTDVLRALQSVHDTRAADGTPLGIIHRDVSPQNIVVGMDGSARLLDFGVAKALGRVSKFTATGKVLGKVAYMAPEQLKGAPLTPAADLYAMGVVLWETLTGQFLYEGGAAVEAVFTKPAPAPSSIVPSISKELDGFVARALARDSKVRFSSGDEMADELEALVPRASATEVTRIVERYAADELERRQELIKRVESWVDDGPPSAVANARVESARPPAPPVRAASAEVVLDADLEILSAPPAPVNVAPAVPMIAEQPTTMISAQGPWETPQPEESVGSTTTGRSLGGALRMKSPSSPSPPSSPWLDAPTIASVSRREDGRRRAAWIAGGAVVVGIVAFVLAHRAGATAEPAPTDVTGSNAIEQDAQSDFPGVALAPPPSNASAAPSTTYRVPPPPLPPDPGEVAAEKSALEKPLEKPEKPERSADPPRPPRNPKPLPRPPPPKNCDPPFRIEADGHKRYIPECLK